MSTAATGFWWNWVVDWNDVSGGSDTQTSMGILTNVVPTDLDSLCSDLNDAIVAAPWFGSGVVLEQSTLNNGFTSGVDVSGFGGSGGTLVPFNSAILVHKNVPTLPNKRKGRNFYPGVQIAGVGASGDLTGGYRSGLQSNFDALHAAVLAITEVDAMIQFTALPTSGGSRTYEQITSFTVAPKVGTLRRRIRR